MAATDCDRSGHDAPDHRTPDQGWRRSSHSQGADSTCVEVAVDDRSVSVRDSKDPGGPELRFSVEEWQAFVLGVRDGEFEPPDVPHRSSTRRAESSSRDRSGSAATRHASNNASE